MGLFFNVNLSLKRSEDQLSKITPDRHAATALGSAKVSEAKEVINEFNPIEKAEQIIAGMPLRPEINHGGNKAAYSPVLDYVKLPEQHTFQSAEEYYSTTFHELSFTCYRP